MANSSSAYGLAARVPLYKGLPSDSILDFFEKFKSLSVYEGWDNETKCRKVLAFLVGRAQRFYHSLPEETRTDWGALKQALLNKFQPAGSHRVWSSAFGSCTQQPGEPAAVFLDDLRRLARNAFPALLNDEEGRDDVIRAQFMNGLESNISEYVNVHLPTVTLEDLEIAVNNYENGRKLARGVAVVTPASEIDRNRVFAGFALRSADPEPEPQVNALSTHLHRQHLDNRQGPRGNSGRQSWSAPRQSNFCWAPDGRPICLRCGSIGHKHRDCHSRTVPQGNGQGSSGQLTGQARNSAQGHTSQTRGQARG